MKRYKFLALLSLLAWGAGATGGARAQTINVGPPPLTQYGVGSFAVPVSLTYSDPFYVNSLVVTLNDPHTGVTVDTSPFDSQVVLPGGFALPTGGTWDGSLFKLAFDNTAAYGTYGGSFTLMGGHDPNTSYNDLGRHEFSVTYAAAVAPEPGSLALLLPGLAGIGVMKRRRKR